MRTVVITGSASGIGFATAAILRDLGDRVIGVDVHDADVTADLTTARGRTAMVEGVRELSGGTVDVVVANAGLALPVANTFAVNYFGAVATLEGLRPMLLRSDAPRAALTSSTASLLTHDDVLVDAALAGDEIKAMVRAQELVDADLGDLVYASSKVALSRWMRRNAPTSRWAGRGIPLNGIGPGVVETPMTADLMSTDEKRAALAEMVPMPLHGLMQAEVPARVLAWLVSEENTHLCGQLVFVDGGSDAVMRGDSTW